MSRRIGRSHRIQLSYQNDLGSQSFSPYFIKFLVSRADGQWSVHRGDRNTGDLCAAVSVRRGDDSVDRYEITRRTQTHEDERSNFGPMFVSDTFPQISPYNEDGSSVWPQSIPYGSI